MSITVSLNPTGTIGEKGEDADADNLALVKDQVDHKRHVEFEEDFHALCVLTMIKKQQQRLLLPSKIIGKAIFNSFMLFFL